MAEFQSLVCELRSDIKLLNAVVKRERERGGERERRQTKETKDSGLSRGTDRFAFTGEGGRGREGGNLPQGH